MPSVRVVYAIPSDRELREDFEEAVRVAVQHAQAWYAEQLEGLTFAVSDPTPQICGLPETAAYYKDDKDWTWEDAGWNRILADLQDCVAIEWPALHHVWVVYPDVDFNCEGSSLGRGGSGLTMLHRGDLEGLINPTTHMQCGTTPRGEFGWIGGLAHELGHAFGLSHPPKCDEGVPDTYKWPPVDSVCDARAMMWLGFYFDYPTTYLTEADKENLRSSRFFYQTHGQQ